MNYADVAVFRRDSLFQKTRASGSGGMLLPVIDTCDIAVIGAGAAGLAAGIFAGQRALELGRRPRILLLDGAANPGAKILVAGGGRCNVTHDVVRPEDFSGPRHVLRHVLGRFSEQDAIAWFESMGAKLKVEDTGKMFPVTNRAQTVLDVLLRRAKQVGCELRASHRVQRIVQQDGEGSGGPFRIEHSEGETMAAAVILATGGKSLPKTGSDGAGWRIAKELGHSVTPTYAALAPLVLDADACDLPFAELSGQSLEVELITSAGGKRLDQRTGSMLWTHFGVSGPVVMDASRYWTIAAGEGRKPRLVCRLLPGLDFQAAEAWLMDQVERTRKRSVFSLLSRAMPDRLAKVVMAKADMHPSCLMHEMTREGRRAMLRLLTELELPVSDHRGWNYAEVTAGGVPLTEVDAKRMASRVRGGLFLVGEILDCDGRIGGFNFQWAWSTGHIAGIAAAESLTQNS